MTSLWNASTRWIGVTEEGLDGGSCYPERPTMASLLVCKYLKVNVRVRANGQLIAQMKNPLIITFAHC